MDSSNEKLREMIWMIVDESSEHSVPLTVTKLNKLLFISDFAFYKLTGKSISGEIYYKNHYGPTIAVRHLDDGLKKTKK